MIARAMPARRREFAAGRRCARAALAAVDCHWQPIGRGPLGEPRWPHGYTGSITHGDRFAAAVARATAWQRAAPGIDLVDEPELGVFLKVARSVLTGRERHWLGTRAVEAGHIARLFSAKEAAIKVVSSRLGRSVDFRELEANERSTGSLIVVAPDGGAVDTHCCWVGGVLLTVGWAFPAVSNP